VQLTTTVLPNTDMLFGEHTHSYTAADEDGTEYAEGWAPLNPSNKNGN